MTVFLSSNDQRTFSGVVNFILGQTASSVTG